jgi:hypothetical protein
MTIDADHIQKVMRANRAFARAAGHTGNGAYAVAASATREMTGFSMQDVIPVVEKLAKKADPKGDLQCRIMGLLERSPTSTSVLANRCKVTVKEMDDMLSAMARDGCIDFDIGRRRYGGKPVKIWHIVK